MSNKVSVEELSRVMLTKSNVHEVNLELGEINKRLDDISQDFNKRISACSLEKDFNFLNTQIEKKADLEFINESLNQKANKQSVANALHRKANRSDIDELLTTKAAISDLDLFNQKIENKVDLE